MLVAARDLVLRHPGADERKIRQELSGNLCRCTGYAGIVHAVNEVIATRRANGDRFDATGEWPVGPAGAGHAVPVEGDKAPQSAATATPAPRAGQPDQAYAAAKPEGEAASPAANKDIPKGAETSITHDFSVSYPPEVVWDYFADVEAVLRCVPGASLVEPVQGKNLRAKMRVKVGPITAEFLGDAEYERDASSWRGTIDGAGHDARSRSRGRGTIRYTLVPIDDGQSTRVDIEIAYALTGVLAQFARTGIVKDVVGRLTGQFARSLEAAIAQRQSGGATAETADWQEQELRAGSFVWALLRDRLLRLFTWFGRGK
jgi:carbon-monoxide dehydrogenase small subunit